MKRMIICVFVLLLSGCSGKGLDRKLSSTEKVDQAYQLALSEATPEQQNVLRERMDKTITRLFGMALNSDPATTEANHAKKNMEELERISQMTVRQLLIHLLTPEREEVGKVVAALESIHNGGAIKVQAMRIEKVALTDRASEIEVLGTLVLRNDVKDFDYAYPPCTSLRVTIDRKPVEMQRRVVNCWEPIQIDPNGGQEEIPFRFTTGDAQMVRLFTDPKATEELRAASITFLPPDMAKIGLDEASYRAGRDDLKKFTEIHRKLVSDLEVLKRP